MTSPPKPANGEKRILWFAISLLLAVVGYLYLDRVTSVERMTEESMRRSTLAIQRTNWLYENCVTKDHEGGIPAGEVGD